MEARVKQPFIAHGRHRTDERAPVSVELAPTLTGAGEKSIIVLHFIAPGLGGPARACAGKIVKGAKVAPG